MGNQYTTFLVRAEALQELSALRSLLGSQVGGRRLSQALLIRAAIRVWISQMADQEDSEVVKASKEALLQEIGILIGEEHTRRMVSLKARTHKVAGAGTTPTPKRVVLAPGPKVPPRRVVRS